MWTLAIFFLTGGQAQLFDTPDLSSCLSMYQNSGVDQVTVERAMCTPPPIFRDETGVIRRHQPVVWIVKPKT